MGKVHDIPLLTFLTAVTKYTTRSNLKEEGFFFCDHGLMIEPIMIGKAWLLEHELATHVVSRKEW